MAILFARLHADVPVKLRRGAWYRVLKLDDLQAVIEVNRRPMGVLRAWLEIQQRPPQRWAVVEGAKENRKAPPHLRGTYGVWRAPRCRKSRSAYSSAGAAARNSRSIGKK
jgi:hypothetical protein